MDETRRAAHLINRPESMCVVARSCRKRRALLLGGPSYAQSRLKDGPRLAVLLHCRDQRVHSLTQLVAARHGRETVPKGTSHVDQIVPS